MKESSKNAIVKMLEEAEKEKFYGELTFKFKEGQIYHVYKGQSIKLEDIE
jgi:hypothetical protein